MLISSYRYFACTLESFSHRKRTSKNKMTSRIAIFSMLFVFLYLAIDMMDAKAWQVFDEACGVTEVYPNCSTLEIVANKARENDNMEIDIKISQLTLASTLNFSKLNSLTINGVPDLTTINCTADTDAGIVLTDIADTVTLNNLQLSFCGSQGDKTYASALTIFGCKNVQLCRIVITRSHGLGLVILNHQGGNVNINFSSFTYNDPKMNHSRGGGIFLKLDHVQSQNQESAEPMTFQFSDCIFANNIALNDDHYCSHYYTVAMGNGRGFEYGGGAYISIGGGLSNISVSFLRCEFSDNKACIGGGLMAKIYGEQRRKINQTRVEVKDSKFYRNGYHDNLVGYHNNLVGYGGGVHFMLDADLDESSVSNCHYIIKSTNFTNNSAANGGGMYFYSSKQAVSIPSNTIHFDRCIFESNVAYMGSAILLAPSTLFRLSSGLPVTPVIRNSQFSSNTIRIYHLYHHENEETYGFGTIYVSSYSIQFEGCNHFQNNWGTSLYIVNGVIDFHKSNASFSNNSGLQGGAVALIGSTMILGPNSYKFVNNSAVYQGGAIYVLVADKTDFTTSRCFLQYRDNDKILLRDWNSVIIFKGNKASGEEKGHSIHATSLHPCRIINNYENSSLYYEYSVLNFTQVFTERGNNITFEDDDGRQIATDGAILSRNDTSTLMIIPGEKYSHGITILDELEQSVKPLFSVAIEPSQDKNISCLNISSAYSEKKIELIGDCKENTTLIFQTLFPRQNRLNLSVSLVECPPGFKFNNKTMSCVCNVDAHLGLFECDNNFSSHLFPGFWAGMVKSGDNSNTLIFATSFNPFYTTNDSNRTNLDKFRLPRRFPDAEFNKALCGNRTGTGCGICLNDSFTVHFNSPEYSCKPLQPFDCRLGWLFYVLSELVPVTFLFIIVLVFNVSFTSGTLNGFILFVQLLSSLVDTSGIIVPNNHSIKQLSQVFHVFYGLLNLDFFNLDPLSFCLWKKATTLGMLSMKYVTILYALILILLVIWIMNKCGGRCFGKYCRIVTVRSSIVHGISTFLVICYAQSVRVSFSLLIPLYIHVVDNSQHKERLLIRVWFNGELPYFGTYHLRYALPALITLLTIGLVPPILLFSYPLINKILSVLGLENQALIIFISHKIPIGSLKPLLDSFQGCFKDNLRFFAGLYFLYRWIILLSYTLIKGFTVYYPTLSGILIFILTLHTICQPYIKRVHNVIDALLFANLLLITAISSFNYNKKLSEVTKYQNATAPAIMQQILICLPLVPMAMYLMWKCLIRCGCLNKTNKAKKLIPGRAIRLKEFVWTIRAENDSDLDSNEVSFTHDRLMDEDVEYREYDETEHTQTITTY